MKKGFKIAGFGCLGLVLVVLSFVALAALIGGTAEELEDVDGTTQCEPCEPIVEKCETEVVEVEKEKIVYKDSPETLELLETYETSIEVMSEAYITIFEVTDACAAYMGSPVHQDYYDVYEIAKQIYNYGL